MATTGSNSNGPRRRRPVRLIIPANWHLTPVNKPGRPRRYPFPSMQVGDSFVAVGMERTTIRQAARHYRQSSRTSVLFRVSRVGADALCERVG